MGRGQTIIVHIPLTLRKRGGRKLVVTPDGADWAPRPGIDNAMVKALARAFRWRRMLDTGAHATAEDLARVKRLAPAYVSGILRLTLLAPEIAEAILDGRQRAELQLHDLLAGFPFGVEDAGRNLRNSPSAWRFSEAVVVSAPPCRCGARPFSTGARTGPHPSA